MLWEIRIFSASVSVTNRFILHHNMYYILEAISSPMNMLFSLFVPIGSSIGGITCVQVSFQYKEL